MSAPKIMVIRHAEKPDGTNAGVLLNGTSNTESLIVQGWQRAGALAVLFDPNSGALQNPNLAVPQSFFAAKFDPAKHSQRPYETLLPLWQRTGSTTKIDDSHKSGDYAKMVTAARACTGTVIIAWQHEDIPAIGNALTNSKTIVPQKWPGDRFDMVWVFNYTGSGYDFVQVPQMVLAGDSTSPI
jgi:hypothetical protein